MKDSRHIKTRYFEFISEKYNPEKYKSFSKLTKQDLFDIAKADPLGELEFSGVWDEEGVEEGDTNTACRLIAESFIPNRTRKKDCNRRKKHRRII